LEESHPDTGTLFANWLSAEANEANHIKRDTPVMCVIGNPPYSGESANKGEWIMSLMEDYKKEPGGKEKLQERNPKWINDDYVKFLRYGQHYIEKNGSGVLAFINPHGFLDNPTFRGMRWHLLKTYDKIYTIDLHGNSKKKETAPDGSLDQNVFDIMQGVSINIFVKTGKKKKDELAKVFHHDLYGLREDKYDFLINNSIASVPYQHIPNVAPNYFMVQKDFSLEAKYNQGIKINELFELNNVGIVTSRDSFVIDKDQTVLEKRIKDFFSLPKEELQRIYALKENKSWKIDQVKIKAKEFQQEFVQKITYRPFDIQFIYYSNDMIERGRKDVMQHFIDNQNLGLVFKLGNAEEESVSAIVSQNIIDFRSWSRPGMQGGDYISPLYIYPDTTQNTLDKQAIRTPNLNQEIVEQIASKIGLSFTDEKEDIQGTFAPIDILDYIYAVLHSPNYRETYKEFLKIDFPRVPYPTDTKSFIELAKLGAQLRQIHLLESPSVEQYITEYPEDGDNIVEKPIYKDGNVYINDSQYFANVPDIAWNFYIGGYQPAQKWLKDRKNRALNFEDILHYQKIIKALSETHRLMQSVDDILIIESS
jgi:predicted helicase